MINDELSALVAQVRNEVGPRYKKYFGTHPDYARDMSAAEKLANEMAAAFTLYINNISGGRWVCTGGPLGADIDLAGDTLAEAISKAYLVFKRKFR